jgi:hypothetical protein
MKALASQNWILVLVVVLSASFGNLRADEFRVEEVRSATAVAPAQLKPKSIVFSDHRDDKLVDPGTGLIRFADWSRAMPGEKRFLSLFPDYREPTIQVTVNGVTKPYTEKLHMYVVEARLLITKPPGAVDLSRLARLDVLTEIDPAIRHRRLAADQARPYTNPESAHNRHPDRRWCEGAQSLCFESRYPLEGKLPTGIRLANKLEEGNKKISEFMEFQSEIRVWEADEIARSDLAVLTGLNSSVAGVVEQTIFDVNQVMQFGKLMAVLQEHPSDRRLTVTTVFMVLAIETDVLERKREFENVPVLRNLIPAQVLMGKSSFNSGESISAGLPAYSRNRIRAIADLLEQ